MSANGRPHCVWPAITIALPALEALAATRSCSWEPNIIFANVFAHALITPVQTITEQTGGRAVVRVQDRPLRDHERERGEGGARDRQVVEDVRVDVVGHVADHRLHVRVVRREVLRRGAGEVERDLVALLDQRQVGGPHQPVLGAQRVGEVHAAVLAVQPRRDPLARALLGHLQHPPHDADDEVRPFAVGDFENARSHAVGRGRARLQVGGDHLRRADAEGVEDLQHVLPQPMVLSRS